MVFITWRWLSLEVAGGGSFNYPIQLPMPTLHDVVTQEINDVKQHFQSHGYLYTISTTGFLILIIIGISLRASILGCCQRFKRQIIIDAQDGRFDHYVTGRSRIHVPYKDEEVNINMVPVPGPPSLYPQLGRSRAI
jgi:hypothetical protein